MTRPISRLREVRKQVGLSQVELAERTGVSQPSISQWENGVLALSMESMQALARALDCPVADLLNDSDNPDRLSVDERQLISSYRSASALQKDLVRRLAAPLEK